MMGKLHEFEHQNAFLNHVQDHFLPIYGDLSMDDLLERCLGEFTQNCKLAAAIFNEGFYAVLKIMETLNIVRRKEKKKQSSRTISRKRKVCCMV
ncbi:uncharacterized protein LOC143143123 [Ptiloglossa arizonensis]|uniref:uncharacterized protein LOC143143123 n=1 Tax=Ptiloglossa arizonensis TaxID=3350558 RepID=UPI003FA1551A